MESTPYIYLGNCQILVCGIFSTSHLTISPLVASWLVAIGLLGSDMIWWGDDRIHRSLQQSVRHLRVCWGLKRNFVQLLYGAVTFILLAVKKLHKKLIKISLLKQSNCRCHSDMDIPAFGASPFPKS